MKRQKPLPQEVLIDYRTNRDNLTSISRTPDGTELQWVPTWEGVLQWAPDDLRADRPLRFWHVFYNKRLKRTVRVRLHAIPRLSCCVCMKMRNTIKFWHKGKRVQLHASNLTEMCKTGFAIADRRHWVVDHIDNNPMNDSPSNLQVISARENVLRSEKVKEINRFPNAERKRRRIARQAVIDDLRAHVIAMLGPDATRLDVELEVALQIQQRGI